MLAPDDWLELPNQGERSPQNGEGILMTTELHTVEARQGDRRKMNLVVLFWAVPAAFIILAAVAAIWMTW
jgi:hypothetical protein